MPSRVPMRSVVTGRRRRCRSYLHGSVGPFQSLLGPLELRRTLPDRKLNVFIGTWNMNEKVKKNNFKPLQLGQN